MTFTVNVVAGWWLLPAFVTVACVIWVATRDVTRGGWMSGVEYLFFIPVASAITLLAWLIWALLR